MLPCIFYVGMEKFTYKICELATRASYKIWGSFHEIGHSKVINDNFPKVSQESLRVSQESSKVWENILPMSQLTLFLNYKTIYSHWRRVLAY